MFRLVVFCALILGVYPTPYGGYGGYSGYNGCCTGCPCDYGYQTGWGGNNNCGYFGCNTGTTIVAEDQCPKIEKCSDLGDAPFTDCKTSDDCLRSEVCCNNPCTSKKQCLPKPKTSAAVDTSSHLECPEIKSCANLIREYRTWKECQTDNDCLRKEKCCKHPCDDNAVSGFPDSICMVAKVKAVTPLNTYYYK